VSAYLVPLTSQTQTLGGGTLTISQPKYLSTGAGGLSFTRGPCGADRGICCAQDRPDRTDLGRIPEEENQRRLVPNQQDFKTFLA
jgi:hypothetical protein